MPNCLYEGCDRPVENKKHQLCVGHYTQMKRGQELRPLSRKANNRKYDDDAKCYGPDCDRRPLSNDLCEAHNHQRRIGNPLTPVGSTVGRRAAMKNYSLTKTCDYCLETKDWQRFVMGTESHKVECRDCYRKRLFKDPDEGSKPRGNKNGMATLMAFLDRQIGVQPSAKDLQDDGKLDT